MGVGLKKRVLALLLALAMGAAGTTVVASAASAQEENGQAQDGRQASERGFDKWGQLLGLAGLAGLGGLALQRTDEKSDDNE
jgi:hypothetical protein